MANLLDQASIVLTPTAYDDGKVLCAKPSEPPYGDFDFSRNSAATRVNAQGLVENVQILSSNLVQNGDFSEEGVQEVSNGSFSQEGSEVVVNGDFALNSSWSGTNTIANGQLIKGSGGGLVYQGTLDGTIKSYKVTIDVAEKNGVSLNLYLGGNQFSLNEGVQTLYVQSGNSNTFIGFNNGADSIINSISCVEVGQDWSLGTGWSIGEDKAVATNSASGQKLRQAGQLTASKTYKLVYEITELTLGGFLPIVGAVAGTAVYSIGTYTEYITTTNDDFYIRTLGTTSGSITNISVKEVGMDWDLDGEVTIGDNLAHFESNTNTYSYIRQDIGSLTTKTYKIQLEVKNYVSGEVQVLFTGSPSALQVLNVSSDGVYTAYLTPNANGDDLEVSRNFDGGNFNFDITNISVIEITDDTNLPRINYEGFSYQDALGSELVTNGDFATDTAWLKGLGWSIGGGTANGLATLDPIRQSISGFTTGKKYKVSFEITEVTNGFIRVYSYVGASGTFTKVLETPSQIGTYEVIFEFGGTNKNLMFYGSVGNGNFTGSIDNVSVKEYLGQEVVPDSGCGAWLFEPQSTNLVTYSEDLSTYTTTQTTVSTTTEKSPIKSVTPFLITEIAATNQHYIGGNSISLSGNNTLSCFVKNVSLGRYFKMWGLGLGAINEAVIFDTNTETIYEPPTTTVYVGGSAKLEDYGNGWFRCSITINTTITSFLAVGLINTVTGFGNNTYLGDITKSVLMTGIQIENQDYATSYIPTSGSTVTRNQDLCNNGGSLATINSTEGVLYAEIAALSDGGTFRAISLNDGTTNNNNVIRIYCASADNRITIIIRSNGNLVLNYNHTLTSIIDFNKIAIKYKQNDFSLWVNGVNIHTETTGNTPIGLNELVFNNGLGTELFYGKTKALAVWKEALSDQELTELTTI